MGQAEGLLSPQTEATVPDDLLGALAGRGSLDALRHRVDVALEALRDCRRKSTCSNDELAEYAAVCRMTNVMRPYLEAVA